MFSSLPGMESHDVSGAKKSNIFEDFEKVWKEYPRKVGKDACRRCCFTRVAQGARWEELRLAAINYSKKCEAEKTEERFIKHGSTFFGRDEWWRDYLQPIQDGSKEHPFLTAAKKHRREDRFGDHV